MTLSIGQSAKSRDTKRIADMHDIVNTMTSYYKDYAAFPVVTGVVNVGAGGTIDTTLNKYMESIPKDPRHDGTDYYYFYSSDINGELCNNPGTTVNVAVIGFYRTESTDTPVRKDLCTGDQIIIDSAYNIVLYK